MPTSWSTAKDGPLNCLSSYQNMFSGFFSAERAVCLTLSLAALGVSINSWTNGTVTGTGSSGRLASATMTAKEQSDLVHFIRTSFRSNLVDN